MNTHEAPQPQTLDLQADLDLLLYRHIDGSPTRNASVARLTFAIEYLEFAMDLVKGSDERDGITPRVNRAFS